MIKKLSLALLLVFCSVASAFCAFPDGWGRRAALTIDHAKVGADSSDYPAYWSVSNLPFEMFDADGTYPALNGGGDIRFSSDSAGATRLPCEVVTFTTNNNPALGVAEIWVKIPSVSSSTNTTIYVWYNKAGETQPVVSDTYGRNAVWTGYTAVYHMNDNPDTSHIIDSTSNASNGTKTGAGSPVEAAGLVGKAQQFNGSNQINLPNDIWDAMQSGSVQFWYSPTSTAIVYHIIGGGNGASGFFMVGHAGSSYSYAPYCQSYSDPNNAYRTTSGAAGAGFRHICWKSSGTAWSAFFQGGASQTMVALIGSNNGDWFADRSTGTTSYMLGDSPYGVYNFSGLLDEVRVSATQHTQGWNNTDYNNQSSPSTFASAGTPETPTAPVTFIPRIIIIN